MGKTYKSQPSTRFDDEFNRKRSGKQSNHANGRKTSGLKTLNNYVEEGYDDDPFEDDIEINDEIFIQHNTNTQ